MKKTFLVLAVAVLMTACAGGAKSRSELAIYDFGPAASMPVASLPPLALEVRLPPWLDGVAMNYRLAYADPRRLHAYAQARWAASPMLLLRQHLQQRLALSVTGAPCLLRIDLDDFSQHFASPTASTVVLRGEGRLLGKGGVGLARQSLQMEVPAASADAAGGAAAMAVAADRLAAMLVRWLQDQDLSVCRGTGRN